MSTPPNYPCHSPWCRFPAFVVVALILGVVLACFGLWDFVRWLLSGIWPVEKKHSERPGY